MSVSTTTAKVAYTLSSTTQTLSVPFYFLESNHLKVIKTVSGADTVLTIGTNYTVTGAGNNAGGSITLTGTGVAIGNVITIRRDVPITQLVDYVYNDKFPAETHERALDKLTMIAQAFSEQAGRTLRFGESEALDGTLNLAARKGKVPTFNATTGVLEWIDKANQVDAAASAAAAAASAASIDPANLAKQDMTNAALATETTRGAVELASQADLTNLLRFDCWGDSLTAGTGGQTPWPTQFETLTGYVTTNDGVGGETSSQIRTRFNAASARWGYNTVIWAGRNSFTNATQTKADIAAMVASLGHKRYLVLSIPNGTSEGNPSTAYTQITTLNADLAAIYGTRFFDVRAYLIASGLSALSITPTAQDIIDVAADTTPASLRLDTIHFTTGVYGLIAQQVANRLLVFENGDAIVTTVAAIRRILASPSPIGSTAAASALFTTLGASGLSSLVRLLVTHSGNAYQPFTLRTSSSTQACGGLEFQSSAGVSKWRQGTHGASSGAETDNLDFARFNGSDWARGIRFLSGGGFEFIENGVAFVFGSGSPEGVVSNNPGSVYFDTSGGAATVYYKTAGSGSSGWKTDAENVQTAVPTSGSTVNMTNAFENNTLYMEPAGVLGTLTINLPGNSDVAQTATIATTQTITALTITNASVINGNITTLAAGGFVSFRCIKFSPKTWTRIA
jgi:hypothetical protein